jgi:predicted kinase
MSKIVPTKPFLLFLYGFPGSGKTYFSRQFAENVQAAHLQADRIRGELFESPRYDKQENAIVNQLMDYMTEEFLSAGLSVIYDTNATHSGQRRKLRDMAFRYHAQPVLVWLQTDPESAYLRSVKRDRRRTDDKYAAQWDNNAFNEIINNMHNPIASENFIVISGKHLFNTQKNAVMSSLRERGIVTSSEPGAMAKPGMVNLIPNQGRVDLSRRNIVIR